MAERNPDKASQGTAGPGSAMHVAGVFFQREAGTRFQFVPNPNIGIQDPLDVLRACDSVVENAVAALGAMTSDFLQTLSFWMDEKNLACIEPV